MLEKKLTTDIKQNGDSCIIISFIIIIYYYTSISSDELFIHFLDKHDKEIKSMSNNDINIGCLTQEEIYIALSKSIFALSSEKIQFNNAYLLSKFQDLIKFYDIEARIVNFQREISTIESVLKTKEAFATITLHFESDVHVVPIGWDKEFYAINHGNVINIGNSILLILDKLNFTSLGDGVLFYKKEIT